MILRPVMPGVAEGAALLEAARAVDEDLGVLVDHAGRDDLVDDQAADVVAQVLHLDLVVVLGGDDHGLDPLGDVALVFDRDLGLAVRAEVLEDLVLAADLAQAADQLVGQHDGHGHQLLGLAAGVAEHRAPGRRRPARGPRFR